MEKLLLPACVLLFFTVLALKVAAVKPVQTKSTAAQRLRIIRILVAALLGLWAIQFNLKKQVHSMDGKGEYQPGTMERIVRWLSG